MQGAFEEVVRKALPGSFCGYRSISYLLDRPGKDGKKLSHGEVPSSSRDINRVVIRVSHVFAVVRHMGEEEWQVQGCGEIPAPWIGSG